MTILARPLGIEIEYMLADAESLAVAPEAQSVLSELAGCEGAADAIGKDISWSNELVAHVIESKVTHPGLLTDQLCAKYAAAVQRTQPTLASRQLQLVPSAAHPFMNPEIETQLWSGEYAAHYKAYHENFNCFTHGFANLQSVHINVPFFNEQDFGEVLQATRLVLPLIPALCASSPILEDTIQPHRDSRLIVYANNQKGVAEITGAIIPEQVYSPAAYRVEILERMYAAISHLQHAQILQTEQLNSRGCIARFDRSTLEIRLCDSQESVCADFAVVYGVVSMLEYVLLRAKELPNHPALTLSSEVLRDLLLAVAGAAEDTQIMLTDFLDFFGYSKPITAGKLWIDYAESLQVEAAHSQLHATLLKQLHSGTLATRILRSLKAQGAATEPGSRLQRSALVHTYQQLAETLRQDALFQAE